MISLRRTDKMICIIQERIYVSHLFKVLDRVKNQNDEFY